MKLQTLAVSAFLSFILVGCAHHRDVRAGADGINRVLVHGEEKDQAEQSAISQASHYCEEVQHKSPVFISEGTAYNGSMDESTRTNVRNASKAAGAVGSGMQVFGGKNEKNVGWGLMGAGTAGDIMTSDNAYTADMKFRCQ